MADDPKRVALAGDDPYDLLKDWYRWWRTCDDAPAKLPNALQVRTAMCLTLHAHDIGENLGDLRELFGADEGEGC